MTGRCKTCTYWVPSKHFNGNMVCSCPKMLYGYGIDPTEPDQLIVEADEGWGMLPQPDFGCVHHKGTSDAGPNHP